MLEVIEKGASTESHPVPLHLCPWRLAWSVVLGRALSRLLRRPGVRQLCLEPARTRRKRRHGAAAPDQNSGICRRCRRDCGATTDSADPGRAFDGWLRRSKILGTPHRCGGRSRRTHSATGVVRVTLYIARHYPMPFAKVHATLRLAPLVASRELVRGLLFSASTPDEQVNTCQRRVNDESYRAFLDMLVLDLVKTKQVTRVPMLVLGAEHDAIVTQRQIRRTAAVYGAEAEIFPGLGHDVMLEPGWRAVAERIDGWLTARGLAQGVGDSGGHRSIP